MENMGICKMEKELKRLNPNISIYAKADVFPAIIVARCSDCSQLNLPTGYEWNEKNGLTNKHKTGTGAYEYFELMTEYEYLTELA